MTLFNLNAVDNGAQHAINYGIRLYVIRISLFKKTICLKVFAMSQKPSKVRTQFYSVAVKTGRSRKKDFTAETEKAMEHIRALAASRDMEGHVKLKKDGEALTKLGIFFMNAPERFAEEVKTLPAIKSVEVPPTRKKPAAKKAGRRRG